ncbi:MAG: UpxY family transcription antiterminator [Bacteroidota bacterium]|nr:UpxY family transcription antiterminator [Bacteroidota bacterium]MDX5429407.1 UpxY family transcription antiterminator [Bacteroidota bacterium]MDX5468198.1 UpxY family transcription antiterminator [Bacteroidota bacterium]
MTLEKRWYAIYTAAKAEKKVSTRLLQQGIEHYLPVQRVLKQWSDRKKWVEEPLFRSYLFVHSDESQYYQILNTHGVVKFITFGGKAVPIPDFQIETIRRLLMESTDFEITQEDLTPGDPVEITAGPLMGTLGELIAHRGEQRIAVKILSLDTAVLLNIPEQFVSLVTDAQKLALFESMRSPKFVGRT